MYIDTFLTVTNSLAQICKCLLDFIAKFFTVPNFQILKNRKPTKIVPYRLLTKKKKRFQTYFYDSRCYP